ncbi:hypothetical protein ACRYCC_37995 [Actinomadura scrupuli]|uniref:hypothetical protein n=1 Tax=Actinomadura scrupuli TaxID=559629 RepID=UPI003D998423
MTRSFKTRLESPGTSRSRLAEMIRRWRLLVPEVVLAVLLTSCMHGGSTPHVNPNEKLPFARPEAVAALLTKYRKEIEEGLGLGKPLIDPSVTPSPCGDETRARKVKGENSNLDSWYVDYSPYSEVVIAYVNLTSRDQIGTAITHLRDSLQKAGWKIIEFNPDHGQKAAELAAEAPEAGYGTRIEGVTTDPRQPRIGVDISSPCLRHPDEQ